MAKATKTIKIEQTGSAIRRQHGASKSAIAAVEKAGGSVKILAPKPAEEAEKAS